MNPRKPKLTRRRVWLSLLVVALVAGLWTFWSVWLSRTYIAFVNYQPISLQAIAGANDNPMVKLFGVDADDIDELDKYDVVFINGMGLNITAEQRDVIQQLANGGKPIYTTMATNPDNNISNLSAEETAIVQSYTMHGGRQNYRSLLSFVRHNIDGKIIYTGEAKKPQETPSDYIYYPADDERQFFTVADYEKYLKAENLYVQGGKRIVVTGQLTDPSDLIRALVKEKKYNVYPVASFTKLLGYVEQIKPDAIINLLCSVAGITDGQLAKARATLAQLRAPKGMLAMMQAAAKKEHEAAKDSTKKDGKPAKQGPEVSRQDRDFAEAVEQIEQALRNVSAYRQMLVESPQAELRSFANALSGGYIAPSPGGDPIANPNTLPTGRNLFAINAEETPTEDAWEKGVALAQSTIADYQKRHRGEYPRKVSFTLWSGEFIQTGGITIAQALYMLGVEPVRDRYGRVSDIRLIPAHQLGRPRIDVVVQTSGQLRDLAASRLFLINRAVTMAAEAADGKMDNNVKAGVEESERYLIDKGIAPKQAREMASYRVFGGLQGGHCRGGAHQAIQ